MPHILHVNFPNGKMATPLVRLTADIAREPLYFFGRKRFRCSMDEAQVLTITILNLRYTWELGMNNQSPMLCNTYIEDEQLVQWTGRRFLQTNVNVRDLSAWQSCI
jgi:hypothetical protein